MYLYSTTDEQTDATVKIAFDDFSPLLICLIVTLFIFIFFSCIYLIIIIIDSVYRQILDIYRYYKFVNYNSSYNYTEISTHEDETDETI